MTTLVKWTPFRELDLMERRMRRMLEDVGFGPITMPAADIYETPEEFVVELEVPGFEEQELGLEVTDHTLTVTGEARAETKKEDEKTFILHERLAAHVRAPLPAARGRRHRARRRDVRQRSARDSRAEDPRDEAAEDRDRARGVSVRLPRARTDGACEASSALSWNSAAKSAQGVEDDGHVDRLLEQRADDRHDEPEGGKDHGGHAQAHAEAHALMGNRE